MVNGQLPMGLVFTLGSSETKLAVCLPRSHPLHLHQVCQLVAGSTHQLPRELCGDTSSALAMLPLTLVCPSLQG